MNSSSNGDKLRLIDNILDSVKQVSSYCNELNEVVKNGRMLIINMKDERTKQWYIENNYPDVSEYEAYYNKIENEMNELCALEKGIIDMPEYLKKEKIPYIQEVIKLNNRLFAKSFSNSNNNMYGSTGILYGNSNNIVKRKRTRKTRKIIKNTRKNKK